MDEGMIPKRANADWLETLQECEMENFRKLVRNGGEVFFVLSADSTFMKPIWLLLVRYKGALMRVTSPADPVIRQLKSIRQVYRVARDINLSTLNISVERKR